MPTDRPFFSVVVPVYNKAPFLARSINSVLTQTFKNYELILVNDASTDGSVDEIHKFSDPRIRLLHRDVPGPGGYAARNLGIAESRADWVAFLDADDEWYPEHLDVLRNLALESQGGVVATAWQTDFGDGLLRPSGFSLFHNNGDWAKLSFVQFLSETSKNRIPIWTGVVAARQEKLQKAGCFPESCKRGGDVALWLQLVRVAGELLVSAQHTAVYHRADSFVIETTPPAVQQNCVHQACRTLMQATGERRVTALLKQISNIHVSYALRKRARDGSLRFSDCDSHYPTAGWSEHLIFRFLSLMPRRVKIGVRSRLLALNGTKARRARHRGSSSS